MNGFGLVADGWTTNSVTTAQMKKTSNSVPMNSARYAAGPRSCTPRPPEIGEFLPVGLDAERDLDLRLRVPSASTDSLKLLAAGRADVSVVDIHDLGLARQEGEPIV